MRLTLLALGAVAAAGLLAATHALRVQRATDDLVADTRQVLHPAAADEHDGVLLQVVPDPRDVRRHLDTGGEPDASHLAQRGVRLLRRGRVHARADAAALRAAFERRRLGLAELGLASLADQLLDGGHGRCGPFRRPSWCLLVSCRPPPPAVGCVARAALRHRKGTKWEEAPGDLTHRSRKRPGRAGHDQRTYL